MKIQEKEIDKLKQNDRIEFYLKQQFIENANENYAGKIFAELKEFILFMGFLLIALPIWKLAFGNEFLLRYVNLFMIIIRVWTIALSAVILIYVALGIINAVEQSRRKKKLFEQFFKLEPVRNTNQWVGK